MGGRTRRRTFGFGGFVIDLGFGQFLVMNERVVERSREMPCRFGLF